MQKSILIIDDDLDIRDWLDLVLSKSEKDFVIFTACDGVEGLKIYKKQSIDLIITDLLMPNKDGFDLLFDLIRECAKTPIIMMTGDRGFNAITPKTLGISAFLHKPFTEETILKEIEIALSK